MNEKQLATLKQLGDLGCYAAMDTRLCKLAYDEIAFLQSRIDELMLEYCPNEMTKEQLDNWATHQKLVDESELPNSIRIN